MNQSLKIVALAVGVVASAGTVAGAVGKAFFVPSEVYHQHVEDEAAVNARVLQSLEDVRKTMDQHSASDDRVSDQIDGLRSDLAVIRARIEEGRR